MSLFLPRFIVIGARFSGSVRLRFICKQRGTLLSLLQLRHLFILPRQVRELQRKIETLENRERMSKMSTTCESSDSMTNLAPQSSQQPLPRHSTHVALQETPRPSQNHFAHHLQNSASGPRHATHHLQHSAGSTQKSYGNSANDSGPSSALKFKATKNVSSAQGSELSSDASQTFTSTLPTHIFLSRSMEALKCGWTRSKWLRV